MVSWIMRISYVSLAWSTFVAVTRSTGVQELRSFRSEGFPTLLNCSENAAHSQHAAQELSPQSPPSSRSYYVFSAPSAGSAVKSSWTGNAVRVVHALGVNAVHGNSCQSHVTDVRPFRGAAGVRPAARSGFLLGRAADLKARVVEVEPRRQVRSLGRQRQHHHHWTRERRQRARVVCRCLERHDLASLRDVGNLVLGELRGAETGDDLARFSAEDETADEPPRRRLEGNLPCAHQRRDIGRRQRHWSGLGSRRTTRRRCRRFCGGWLGGLATCGLIIGPRRERRNACHERGQQQGHRDSTKHEGPPGT